MRVNSTMVSVTVPAGVYVIGDPCYSLASVQWDTVLDTSYHFSQPIGYVDGNAVLGFETADGDGTYVGSDGFEYSVDAGLIGLVPVSLASPIEEDAPRKIIEFKQDTVCTNDNGYMTFGSITIDTDPKIAEEDYEEEYED